jgi:hypothetical protein
MVKRCSRNKISFTADYSAIQIHVRDLYEISLVFMPVVDLGSASKWFMMIMTTLVEVRAAAIQDACDNVFCVTCANTADSLAVRSCAVLLPLIARNNCNILDVNQVQLPNEGIGLEIEVVVFFSRKHECIHLHGVRVVGNLFRCRVLQYGVPGQ